MCPRVRRRLGRGRPADERIGGGEGEHVGERRDGRVDHHLVPDGERHRLYTTHPEVRVRYSVLPVRGGVAGPASAPRP